MRKFLLIILLIIPLKIFSQSDSKFGYTGGFHIGGLTGVSVDGVLLYKIKPFIYGVNPFISADIGNAGTKYRLGTIIWSTTDGPKDFKNRMPILYYTGFEFSLNYGYLWSIDNKPKFLFGFGENNRYFGLESGIGFFGLNYKFGYYFSNKGNIMSHTIGIGL